MMAGTLTFFDQRIETALTFALRLTDAFTGLETKGRVEISLNGSQMDVPRNRSGYHLFLNLPLSNPDGSASSYRLEVRSDFYVTQIQENIRPREMDRRSPVVFVSLAPLPAYPFPAGTTLIRGAVQDQAGHPVSRAVVEVPNSAIQTVTTASGECVLYFRQITPDDVQVTGGKRLMMVNSSTDLQIMVSHPDFKSKTVVIQAEEGRENGVGGTIQLQPK